MYPYLVSLFDALSAIRGLVRGGLIGTNYLRCDSLNGPNVRQPFSESRVGTPPSTPKSVSLPVPLGKLASASPMSRIHTLSRIARQSVAHTSQRGHATTVSQALQHQRITREDIRDIYHSPLLDLVFRAASIHRQHHDPSKIQLCTLMNIKCGCEAIPLSHSS